jgi:hypothetical protein
MNEGDIRQVVQAVLNEENRRHANNLDDVVLRAVATILTSFGIDEQDRQELKADFIHLRKWRKSVEQAQSLTARVVVISIVTGIAGALWLGLKDIFMRH